MAQLSFVGKALEHEYCQLQLVSNSSPFHVFCRQNRDRKMSATAAKCCTPNYEVDLVSGEPSSQTLKPSSSCSCLRACLVVYSSLFHHSTLSQPFAGAPFDLPFHSYGRSQRRQTAQGSCAFLFLTVDASGVGWKGKQEAPKVVTFDFRWRM